MTLFILVEVPRIDYGPETQSGSRQRWRDNSVWIINKRQKKKKKMKKYNNNNPQPSLSASCVALKIDLVSALLHWPRTTHFVITIANK